MVVDNDGMTRQGHKLVCREGFASDGHAAKNMTATYCAREGKTCKCSGTVYYGYVQSKMKLKDLTTGSVKSKESSGRVTCKSNVLGDPKHGQHKACYCNEAYTDYVDEAVKTCSKVASTGSKYSYHLQSLLGNAGKCDKNEYMQEWKMNPNKVKNKLMFDFKCCKYEAGPQSERTGQCITKLSSLWGGRFYNHLYGMPKLYMKCLPGMALSSWEFVGSKWTGLRYTCCDPPAGRGFGACTDVLSPRKEQQADVRRMGHPAVCPAGEAMAGWSLQHDVNLKEMWSRTTCCQLIETQAYSAERKACSWAGFPHVITFDGKEAEFERVGSGATSYVTWLVKSPEIRIQSRVSRKGSLEYVTEVAVAGDFLQGHSVVVSKDGTNDVVKWDGKVVKKSLTIDGIGTIDILTGKQVMAHGASAQVELLFPGAVEIMMILWDNNIDGDIVMEGSPGQQAGHCGNNNGEASDDTLPNWKVTPEENLFQPGKSTGKVGAAAQSISACPTATLTQATAKCGLKYTAGDDKQEFIDMCVWDYCFDKISGFVGHDFEDQKEFEQARLSTTPRRYRLVVGSYNYGAAKVACPAGTTMASITSKNEWLAAVQSAQPAIATGGNFVWLGGYYKSGWRWADGTPMNYQHFAKRTTGPYLCMHVKTGRWYGCKYFTSIPVLCLDEKHFDLSSPVLPHQMRDACGRNSAPAMIKTISEQAHALDAMKVHTGPVWLGAYHVRLMGLSARSFWTYLDGSALKWGNWKSGQPDGHLQAYDDLFMCAEGQTGKWQVCPSTIHEQPVLCESTVPNVCFPGMLDNRIDLGLAQDGTTVADVHDGFCYYLSKAGEDCSQTCSAQTGGLCDEAGMQKLTLDFTTCKNVGNLFQMGVPWGGAHQYEVTTGDRGCNYVEQSPTSKRIIFSSGTSLASCSTKPSDPFSHRICACTSVHGASFPDKYTIQPYDVAVITASGYDTDIIRVEVHSASQDCSSPAVVDPTARAYSSKVGAGTGQLAGTQSWTPSANDANQFLEMDAGSNVLIRGVVTQGLGQTAQQVTEFTVSYSMDRKTFHPLDTLFTYDFERAQMAVDFESPVYARYIRVIPTKWSGAIAMKAGLRKCPGTGSIELQANPVSKQMGWCAGSSCNLVSAWPFGPKTDPFSILITSDKDKDDKPVFNVKVNGVLIDALQKQQTTTGAALLIEREVAAATATSGFGLVTASGAADVEVSYEHPDSQAASTPCSMSSTNGVMPHDYESFGQAVTTFNFAVKLTAAGAAFRCIRCEADVPSINVGNHIMETNQQLVVDIEGNTPRRQTFVTKLDLNKFYNVTISYVKADKTLELYFGPDRIESLSYTAVRGTGLSLQKGYLGGWHLGHHLLAGSVEGFVVTHAPPLYRPAGASCASFKCPTNFHPKPLCAALSCAGQTCDATKDRDTCCDEVGTCAIFSWCPLNMAPKANPEKIKCKDKLCKETDYSVCCEKKGMCSQTKCGKGTLLIANANTTFCITADCNTDKDTQVCCQPEATCETLTCPEGYAHKPNSAQITCKSQRFCTNLLDKDHCCGKVGLCSSFSCPTNYTLKANAKHLSCTDPSCQNTPFTTCCDPSSSCTTMKCPTGRVQKFDAATLRCKGAKCESSDADHCCTKPEVCRGLVCPTPYVHKSTADTVFCKGLECTVKDDKKTCCSLPGRCPSVSCPKQYTHRWNAKDILCLDRLCHGEDFKRCCAEEGHCHTMRCAPGYVHRDEAKLIHCLHPKCQGAQDNDRCCIKQAKCTDMTCPAHMAPKAHAVNITCKGPKCGKVDEKTCCTTPGKCPAFKCPVNMAHRHNAADIYCDDRECKETNVNTCCVRDGACSSYKCPKEHVHKKDVNELVCHGTSCGGLHAEKDTEICCEKIATCNTLVCPKPFVLKGNAKDIPCKGSKCDVKVDKKTCCDMEGRCSTFKCPEGMLNKPKASHIFCHDKSCKETPYSVCCAEEGRCGSMKCPAGYFQNPATVKAHCTGFKCTEASDRDKCCLKGESCGSFQCPAGWTIQDDANKLFCNGLTCDPSRDKRTCCTEVGKCTSYNCPDKYVLKHNAANLLCKESSCNSTSFDYCCVEEGKCTSMKCPAGMVHKDDAPKLNCKGFLCDPKTDVDRCCIASATCNSNACLKTQVLRSDYKKHTCKADKCNEKVDNTECCSNKGYCPIFKCPDGFEHQHNATHIRCSDDKCEKTEYSRCCVEEGTCGTYRCPANYVRRPGAHRTHCKGVKCTDKDMDTCCMEVATCGGYECPVGHFRKGHANKIKCSGAKCTKNDAKTCCAPEGRCDIMQCPENFQHKSDAATTWCDDKLCNKTDVSKCCAEDGHCATMHCPHTYALRANLTGIHCHSWKCTPEKDRDTCCERTAECADEICPFEKVLKGNATNRFCEGPKCELDPVGVAGCHKFNTSRRSCETGGCFWLPEVERAEGEPACTEKDVETCCAVSGTCSSMTCPEDYVLRANAKKTYCTDMKCDADDYDRCCVEQNHCLGYTCPTWFAHKASVAQLFCKGATCEEEDRDVCCDPVATCNTMECAAGTVKRKHAEHLRCLGVNCTAKDLGTCCETQGHCGVYTCPYGWMHKPNAKDITCPDATCADSPYQMCCIEKAHCSTMDCGVGYFPRAPSANAYCAGATCRDSDTPTCCDKQDNCGSYLCPEPYTQIHKPQEVLCHGRNCADSDLHTCCGILGMCSSMVCPAGQHHRGGSHHIPCPNGDCGQPATAVAGKPPLPSTLNASATAVCCAPTGSCSTYKCPTGLVLVDDADAKKCASGRCTVDDEDTCCVKAASCTTATCPATHMIRPLAAHLYCARPNCTAADSDTCCAPKGLCSTHTCGVGLAHRFDASRTLCPGGTCSDALCCSDFGTCNTFPCPAFAVRKAGVNTTKCRAAENGGAGGCTDADVGTCCDVRMPCSGYTCPAGKVWKEDAFAIRCAGGTCSDAVDADTCCDLQASCTSTTCPPGSRSRPGATCAGPTCVAEDRQRCCQESCKTFDCPYAFTAKADKESLFCVGEYCGSGDEQSCCDRRATCADYKFGCPDKHHARGHEALCKTTNCTKEDDEELCCAGTCAMLECPDSTHIPKASNINGLCASFSCNSTDRAMCCSARESCSNFKCPAGTVHNGHLVRCMGEKCEPDDYKTCCTNTCDILECVEGYVKRAEASTLDCKGLGCTDPSDMTLCCEEASPCSNFQCPAGLVNRGAYVHCNGHTCSASDEAACCMNTCANYTCPAPYTKLEHSDDVHCHSHNCNDHDDRDTCCAMRAMCSTYECPAGLVGVSTDQYCSGIVCNSGDTEICCRAAKPELTYEFVEAEMPGKCLGSAGEEPEHSRTYTQQELESGHTTCGALCLKDNMCWGYSPDTEGNCIAWLVPKLIGGGSSQHGEHCFLKHVKDAPMEPAPAPCPTNVAMGQASTTKGPAPIDIIPQQQMNKQKRDATVTFFIVFCVILLAGGLIALMISVAMSKATPAADGSAPAASTMATPLTEAAGGDDF